MTDYTDLKARLRAYLPPLGELDGTAEVLGLPAILRATLAAIEELEQRVAAPAPTAEPVCNCRQEHRKRAGPWLCPLHGSVDGTHMGDDGEVTESVPRAAPQPAQGDEARILREFCGWLSADIPELHKVDVPLLAESLARFLARKA